MEIPYINHLGSCSVTCQENIGKYVYEHFDDIDGKVEGAGADALAYALEETRSAMRVAGESEEDIQARAESLAVSMLHYELFNRYLCEEPSND